MAGDPLEEVLRLVAEGRLTAEEAAPILAALDDHPGAGPGPVSGDGSASRAGAAPKGSPRQEPPGGFGASPPPSFGTPSGATTLRLEVRENGRQVVSLRLPIAVGRLALDRVPGLSGEQVERVREALAGGMRGPILQVEDGDSGVRIVLE
ncbi:MAG TPA: hypothetical protein VES19_16985 [Candidatus Limnocylindrales bacterium]|nr:hypothetical protein [Candidatus Limnocylindrales bacterium]